MNIIFTALTLISLVILTIHSPASAFPTMIEGMRNAITLMLKLTAIYAVWLSVLKMMQATELDKKLSNGLKPLIRKFFKNESDEAYKWISINLASNMLGMGGATTPAGIKSMNAMCREEGKATDNMLLLLVINATSIQILPATVIALRATAGSANASSIFFPTIIATFFSTLIGCILCKLFSKKEKSNPNNIPKVATIIPQHQIKNPNSSLKLKLTNFSKRTNKENKNLNSLVNPSETKHIKNAKGKSLVKSNKTKVKTIKTKPIDIKSNKTKATSTK